MKGRAGLACLLAATAASCGQDARPTPLALRAKRVAQLETIAAACRLPAGALRLVGTEELHFQPPPDSSYERVDCVLKALSRTDIPMKTGFVGGEADETGNRN